MTCLLGPLLSPKNILPLSIRRSGDKIATLKLPQKSLSSQKKPKENWLVVSTHLKNINQNGNLPQIGVNIKNMKPPPRKTHFPRLPPPFKIMVLTQFRSLKPLGVKHWLESQGFESHLGEKIQKFPCSTCLFFQQPEPTFNGRKGRAFS